MRHDPVAVRFGGHTQLMRHWCLSLSLAYHAAFLVASILVEPQPTKYNQRVHARRESIYTGTARLGSMLVPFSAVAAAASGALALLDANAGAETRRS